MAEKRAPKYKTFGGKRYERVGTAPTRSKRVADNWADFNRKANNLLVRVIPVSSGYEIYVRRG